LYRFDHITWVLTSHKRDGMWYVYHWFNLLVKEKWFYDLGLLWENIV